MGSRSKYPRLQGLSLSNYNKTIPRTQTENREVWQCMTALNHIGYDMEDTRMRILATRNSNTLKNHFEQSRGS